MQLVWYQNRHVPHWTAGTPSGQFLPQMAQGNLGVRGPGLSSMSEERIKIRAKKLLFFMGLGGNFGLKMFCFDLRECPVEERML